MKSRASLYLAMGSLAAFALVASLAGQGRQGPGVQAPADAPEPELLKTCKVPPAAPGGRGGRGEGGEGGRGGGALAESTKDVTSTAIPGVIAAGQKWKVLWSDEGNNADGIVGANDGSVLIAQNDKSDVVKVDKNGKASVVYTDTNTGGTLGMNNKGELFVASRGYQAAILQLAPKRRIVANKVDGDWFDCIGGVLHDLSPDSKGGIYVAIGKLVLFIGPTGNVTKYDEPNLRANGIILSPDEKRLYVTTGVSLMVFDVKADGQLTNLREFTKLPDGPGDGLAVDAAGRCMRQAAAWPSASLTRAA
ncbi:MAG: SMP-30/gluconolactonase/LRE family protein [Acidobacteriota bacterium]|nr:SMP-30/gluconolactonase/LRE family protein [Acidobacteriota bacterium]